MDVPNLIYIEKIANGNEELKNKIIIKLEEELILDKKKYKEFVEISDFVNLKVYIHRIKNKMVILGYIDYYKLINDLENNLYTLNKTDKNLIEKITQEMLLFLKKQKYS